MILEPPRPTDSATRCGRTCRTVPSDARAGLRRANCFVGRSSAHHDSAANECGSMLRAFDVAALGVPLGWNFVLHHHTFKVTPTVTIFGTGEIIRLITKPCILIIRYFAAYCAVANDYCAR